MTKDILRLSNLMQAVQNATQSDVEPYEDEYIQSVNQRIAFTKEALFILEKELKNKQLFECFHPINAIEQMPIEGTNKTFVMCHECGEEI